MTELQQLTRKRKRHPSSARPVLLFHVSLINLTVELRIVILNMLHDKDLVSVAWTCKKLNQFTFERCEMRKAYHWTPAVQAACRLQRVRFTSLVIDRPLSTTAAMLPDALTSLDVRQWLHQSNPFFDHHSNRVVFPSNLTTLRLGGMFNRPLITGVLPTSLTWLELGDEFNQPLLPNVLPISLVTLRLGSLFNQPLLPATLPELLTSLVLGLSFDHPLLANVLPESLTSLDIGNDFDHPLAADVLPASITFLRFGHFFNRHLLDGVLPAALTTLDVGGKF